jgi:hypothetical protein
MVGRARPLCTEAMFTILPRPRSIIPRATTRETTKGAVRFVSSTASQSSSGKDSSG